MEERKQLGLIGIGLLGAAMAERLLEQGWTLRGFDRDPARRHAFGAAGGAVCENALGVLRSSDRVLLSLPTSRIVGQLLTEHAPHIRQGSLIIDTTTGAPDEMIAIGDALARRESRYVEATVAGSSVQMRVGEAILFVGCEKATLDGVRDLLSALADKFFHLGPVGAASKLKLVHNLILGLHRAVLAEGLSFAESLGFDPGAALSVLRETPAASAVMATKGEKMVQRDFEPQARLSQHLKDVRLILEESAKRGAMTPLTDVHRRLLEDAQTLGWGDADNSAIIEAFRRGPDSESSHR